MDSPTTALVITILVSICLTALAIGSSFWINSKTSQALADITAHAATIETVVTGSHADLLKSVLTTAERQQELNDRLLTGALLPDLLNKDEAQQSRQSELVDTLVSQLARADQDKSPD